MNKKKEESVEEFGASSNNGGEENQRPSVERRTFKSGLRFWRGEVDRMFVRHLPGTMNEHG